MPVKTVMRQISMPRRLRSYGHLQAPLQDDSTLTPTTLHLTPDTYFVPTCDTSQTVTPMVAAVRPSRLFSCARVKNMGTGMIVGVVIVSPVVLSIAILLGASEDWLHRFAELVRSLGRPM